MRYRDFFHKDKKSIDEYLTDRLNRDLRLATNSAFYFSSAEEELELFNEVYCHCVRIMYCPHPEREYYATYFRLNIDFTEYGVKEFRNCDYDVMCYVYAILSVQEHKDDRIIMLLENIEKEFDDGLKCDVIRQFVNSAKEKGKGNLLTLHRQVCMPDHWHGVIEVHATMNKSLGHIVQYVKSSCTARWRALTGSVLDSSSSQAIRHMSEKQRNRFYSTLPFNLQPLWDDEYDDTICLSNPITGAYDQRHFSAMIRYVDDNPRRAIIRRLRPQFMQRCLHVRIDGRDYAAFGNLFLLRWARKVQVFCHRKAPDGHTPYEQTEAYRKECIQWKKQVMDGATVIVTPGISMGERIIKDRCLESGYPLIHLQKEPIGAYWKPEERRFNACVNGTLLILAPWKVETLGDVEGVPSSTNYSIFHNLNALAKEICEFYGEAVVVNG